MRKFFRPYTILAFVKYICYAFHANPIKSLIYLVLLILFIVEFVVYYCITFSWNVINCERSENCTKILIAADPQLIGLNNEPVHFLTPISIWDSDRYLAKTFSHAFAFTKPDVIIFLGDLFDEGSTASESEFKLYHRRLLNIFSNEQYNSTQHIWLPGDNDIGGEGTDWVTEFKVKRFEHTFLQPSMSRMKNVKFYNINELTLSVPKVDNLPQSSNSTIVGLSHMPLLNRGTSFVEKVLHTLKPHLFFTAHNHQLMVLKTAENKLVKRLISYKQRDENKVYNYDLDVNHTVYEIAVPTCSYRMGTNSIGYGFAVIENKSVHFTVLWSPSRYLQLAFYAITVLFIFIYLSCVCTKISDITTRKTLYQNV